MNKKIMYEAPESELFFVKIEENFCGTNDGIPNVSGDDVEDDSDEWN